MLLMGSKPDWEDEEEEEDEEDSILSKRLL